MSDGLRGPRTLLERCEKERDEALRDARRLRAAARAFLNAYAHDIGWQDELKALAKAAQPPRSRR